MVFPEYFYIVLIVSAVLCSIGFFRFVWFLSIGYGIAAAGIGATLFILSLVLGKFDIFFTIQCALLIIYGIRLGGFLLIRELKNVQYRAKLKEVGGDAKVPVFVSFFVWIYVAILYYMEAAAPIYRLLSDHMADGRIAMYIGIGISAIGIIIESVADKQKSKAKVTNPDMPAMQGLYKMCRCPNYFGEITFWTGMIVSGIGSLEGWQWLIAAIGYVCIVYIMFSGAKRVETRHIKHYGSKPEYNEYANKTPLLIPLLPIYHFTSPEKIAAEEAKKAAKKAAKQKA